MRPSTASNAIVRRTPVGRARAYLAAAVKLAATRDQLAAVERLVHDELAALSARVGMLERQSASPEIVARTRAFAEQQAAIANQLDSVPVAMRDLARRIGMLEAERSRAT